MLPHLTARPNLAIHFEKLVPELKVKSPPKYTFDDWVTNNDMKFLIIHDQEKRKEKIVAESKRLIDEVNEKKKRWQDQVEHHTKERVNEVEFLCEELKMLKKKIMQEIEALTVYVDRIERANIFLQEKALKICQQCLAWREDRIGVELCTDDVEIQLNRELRTIQGSQQVLTRTQKEANEQIRRLRAAMFSLDTDINQKDKAKVIDVYNNTLKQTLHSLGEGVDWKATHCPYSLQDWLHETNCNIRNAQKELTSGLNMHLYTDSMLSQICDDMYKQTENTNQAFKRRIDQVKAVKHSLEEKNSKTVLGIRSVEDTIKDLQEEIADQDRAILLCKTRLSNRTLRPGIEFACDFVHESLHSELNALQATICRLRQKLMENKALLRYLLHTQIMLMEEINLKTNDLKIDESDCMNLRLELIYTHF